MTQKKNERVYLAIVKNIPEKQRKENKHHWDTFEMPEMIGETIEVTKKCPGWYMNNGYNYHRSWIKIVREK